MLSSHLRFRLELPGLWSSGLSELPMGVAEVCSSRTGGKQKEEQLYQWH